MTAGPFAPKMTEAQRREVMRRCGRGESLNRIAKDFGTGSAASAKTVKRRGLVLREKKYRQVHVSPEPGKKILEDSAAGKAVRRIAAGRGVSTGIAGRTIKKSGAYKPAQIRKSTGWTKPRFKEEQHDGRVGRSGSPARAGVKSPERETTRWTAARPLKEIEG